MFLSQIIYKHMDQNRRSKLHPLLKDLISGYAGGIAYILSGQPLDIVKVRFQSLNESSILSCLKNIYRTEGLLAFWKGSFFPLISVGLSVSLLFTANERIKQAYRKKQNRENLKPFEYFFIGGFAGVFFGIFVTPIEHVKVRLQIQKSVHPLYKNSIDCARKIFTEFGFKGLYKGLSVSIAREFIGCGVYFAAYFWLKETFRVESHLPTMLIGGLSGIAAWNATFFLDNLKTKIQSDDFLKPVYTKGNFLKVLTLKHLCIGYLPGTIKSFPSNAATFLAYEVTGKYLK